jgi:adenosine deaminase
MQMSESQQFIAGLEQHNRILVRAVPKSDLHSHAGLAFRREVLERWLEQPIAPPPPRMDDLSAMNQWIKQELTPFYSDLKGFSFAMRAAMAEAWNDGITLLEMSVDVSFIGMYGITPEKLANIMLEAHRMVAPEITFRPELGIARDADPETIVPLALECVNTGLFHCIDLYGTEYARTPEVYRDLFRIARKAGLKCKVHVGEFGTAESLMHTIKILEPHAIQHGIAAVKSNEAMALLAREKIPLNICPTSNIRLSRVPDYATHPIRQLFHEGVPLTINSDDIMVFDQNVSDEYLHLYRAGSLSAAELDEIRTFGLSC